LERLGGKTWEELVSPQPGPLHLTRRQDLPIGSASTTA
jgi:hypothetical protein